MAADRQFAFGNFRFDVRTGQLWRDGSEMRLTPRAAAVLQLLTERAQELVTKEEIFERVWGGLAIGDDSLTSCIRELRGALGDDARRPQTIETWHRRGYRLMLAASRIAGRSDATAQPEPAAAEPSRLVGRAAELEELVQDFEHARSGQRQVVFVTGEPGIGKSSLADAFLAQQQIAHAVRIAQGQCLDHHGMGEPYLPLIEALTRLAGSRDGKAVKEILWTQAPSWLAQMPSLWTRSERSLLEARGHATRERMMRELTYAVETIASEVPLLLKLEDIHWSDASTLDWLAHVARRPEPARLMVLATFRPVGAETAKAGLDGLVAELAVHRRCREIALRPLSLEAIETYLAARLGARAQQLHDMVPLLLERTGGNPLFVTGIVNQLAQQPDSGETLGALVSIPPDVRRFIDRQIDCLDESDRSLLSAASVIRREFATTAVAAAMEIGPEQVEARCAGLARQGVFIIKSGSTIWPDGTPAELYAFRHDLYRELLYDCMPPTRRALCHGRVGRRLEGAWAGRLEAIAGEMAEHFDRANEPGRAIPHHRRAAAKAMRRSANGQAIRHLQQALDAIGHIADEIERTKVEAQLHVGLAAAFTATRGFGAPEALEANSRAEALCERLPEGSDIFPALWGVWLVRWGRSEIDEAWRLCGRLLALAEKSADAGIKLQAHHAAWATSLGRGELADVLAHAEAGLAIYDATLHQAMASSYGNHDANTCARNFSALSLALAGEQERARAMADASLSFAKSLNDPFSLALTLFFASAVAQILGDVPAAAAHAGSGRQIATEHGLAVARAWSTAVVGWCAAETGDADRGIALLTEAVGVLRAAQSHHFMTYLLGLLADTLLRAGRDADAMTAIEEGMSRADAGGERYYGAELHRLQGELLARPPYDQRTRAKASFRAAIELARQQGAAALERKADASLRRWS